MTSQHEDTESIFGDESSWDAFDFGPQMLDENPPTAPAAPTAAPAPAPAPAPAVPSGPVSARPTVARPRPAGAPAPGPSPAFTPPAPIQQPAQQPTYAAPSPAYTPVSVTPPPAPLHPVQAAPVQAAPVQAAPVQAAPVQAAPVQAAPVQAAPVQPASVQAAPVAETSGQASVTSPGVEAPLPAWATASLDDLSAAEEEWDSFEDSQPVPQASPQRNAPVAVAVPTPVAPAPFADDADDQESDTPRRRGRGTKTRAKSAPTRSGKPKGRAAKASVTAKAKRQAEYAGPGTGTKVARGLWYAVLGVLLLGGVKNVLTAEEPVDTKAIASDAATLLGKTDFPIDSAEAFATRFAREYLTYNQRGYDQRITRLAAYAPAIVDEGWGWDGAGKQQIIAGPFVGGETDPTDDNNAIITVLAQVDSGAWISLAVPVYAAESGALVISGAPAFVALPALAINPDPESDIESFDEDDELAVILAEQVLPGFFEAWGSSDQTELDRYTTLDASVAARTGLAGAMVFRGIEEVSVPVGETERVATVSVEWDAGRAGSYRQAYKVTIAQGPDGRWSVADIEAGVLIEGDDPEEGEGPVVLPEDLEVVVGEAAEDSTTVE